jgi:ATP-dependent helicase/nuclease subunit B
MNDFEEEIASEILSNIKKAIEIDEIRTNSPFGKSIFTGSLLSSKVDEELQTTFQNLRSRQYSISQLENYGKCPFKYFIERILNIKVIEEPTEDIEPIEMGRILHAILFEFYVEMRKKKIQLINCSDNEFEIAKRTIIQIAEKKLEKSFFKSPITFHDREKIIGINGIFENSILYRFLLFERNNSEPNYIPKYFEVGFGKLNDEKSDESLSTSEPLLIDGIKLRGKIDRIEINDEEKKFNVVDYKLNGKKPSGPEFKAGVSLQLPLYLYATADLLEKKYGEKFSPNEMFIYSLKYKNDEFGKKLINPKIYKNVDEVISDTLSHIKNYVDAISNGEFTLSPHDKRKSIVCKNCSFNLACRIDEVKELNVMEEEAAE